MSTLTMTRTSRRRRTLTTAALTGTLLIGSTIAGMVPQAAATGSSEVGPAAAEAQIVTTNITIGDKIRVTGTGWTHSSGTSGSRIALKIETVDPGVPIGSFFKRLKTVPEVANTEVWKVVDADNNGDFDVKFPLPNGTSKGKNGSDPAMTKKGTYGVRLLTGSLITGDTIRSMKIPFEAKAQPKIKVSKAPVVGGTPKAGKTVSAAKMKFSVSKPSLAYRWYVGSSAVGGSAGAKKSFKLTSAHAGKKVSVKVTASKSGYRSVSATSKKVTVKR